MTVDGTCTPQFEPVRAALAQLIDSGQDIGASAAVVMNGELVADVWGGHLDEERTVPWQRDTIINVFSTTKTMTNLSALLLADRGELDIDAPVARYWPEFKANGKDDVLVRHLLGHTAGLAGWEEPITVDELTDWERCTSLLAAQAPWWVPGDGSGYHAVTQGFLVGEVVRRITGQSLGSFFASELAGPTGADFHIGTGPELDDRVALLLQPPKLGIDDLDSLAPGADREIAVKTLTNPLMGGEMSWTIPWRRAEIPAANGHGNARSVALAQSVLSSGGEAPGGRIMSNDGCRARLHRAVERHRSRARCGTTPRGRLRLGERNRPASRRAVLLLGRVRRVPRRERPRLGHDRRVRDESDVGRHARRRAGRLDPALGIRLVDGHDHLIDASPVSPR